MGKITVSISADTLKEFNRRVPKDKQNIYLEECILMEFGGRNVWIVEDIKPAKKKNNST